MPFVSHWELIAIVLALMLLFGPKHIPKLARSLGGGIREVRREVREVTAPLSEPVEQPKRPS